MTDYRETINKNGDNTQTAGLFGGIGSAIGNAAGNIGSSVGGAVDNAQDTFDDVASGGITGDEDTSVGGNISDTFDDVADDIGDAVPDVEVPDVEVPDVEVPDVQVPDVDVPDVEVPEVDVPDVDVPDVDVPDFEAPEVDVPEFEAPDVGDTFDDVAEGVGDTFDDVTEGVDDTISGGITGSQESNVFDEVSQTFDDIAAGGVTGSEDTSVPSEVGDALDDIGQSVDDVVGGGVTGSDQTNVFDEVTDELGGIAAGGVTGDTETNVLDAIDSVVAGGVTLNDDTNVVNAVQDAVDGGLTRNDKTNILDAVDSAVGGGLTQDEETNVLDAIDSAVGGGITGSEETNLAGEVGDALGDLEGMGAISGSGGLPLPTASLVGAETLLENGLFPSNPFAGGGLTGDESTNIIGQTLDNAGVLMAIPGLAPIGAGAAIYNKLSGGIGSGLRGLLPSGGSLAISPSDLIPSQAQQIAQLAQQGASLTQMLQQNPTAALQGFASQLAQNQGQKGLGAAGGRKWGEITHVRSNKNSDGSGCYYYRQGSKNGATRYFSFSSDAQGTFYVNGPNGPREVSSIESSLSSLDDLPSYNNIDAAIAACPQNDVTDQEESKSKDNKQWKKRERNRTKGTHWLAPNEEPVATLGGCIILKQNSQSGKTRYLTVTEDANGTVVFHGDGDNAITENQADGVQDLPSHDTVNAAKTACPERDTGQPGAGEQQPGQGGQGPGVGGGSDEDQSTTQPGQGDQEQDQEQDQEDQPDQWYDTKKEETTDGGCVIYSQKHVNDDDKRYFTFTEQNGTVVAVGPDGDTTNPENVGNDFNKLPSYDSIEAARQACPGSQQDDSGQETEQEQWGDATQVDSTNNCVIYEQVSNKNNSRYFAFTRYDGNLVALESQSNAVTVGDKSFSDLPSFDTQQAAKDACPAAGEKPDNQDKQKIEDRENDNATTSGFGTTGLAVAALAIGGTVYALSQDDDGPVRIARGRTQSQRSQRRTLNNNTPTRQSNNGNNTRTSRNNGNNSQTRSNNGNNGRSR